MEPLPLYTLDSRDNQEVCVATKYHRPVSDDDGGSIGQVKWVSRILGKREWEQPTGNV